MDPFNQHEDFEIWEALRQCGLAGRTPGTSIAPSRAQSRSVTRANSTTDLAEAGEGGERVAIRSLDEAVAVGGKNFSECLFSHDQSHEAELALASITGCIWPTLNGDYITVSRRTLVHASS